MPAQAVHTGGVQAISSRPLPRPRAGLSARRRWAGVLLGLALLSGLTPASVALRDEVSLESVLLTYILAVIAVSVLGGVLPGVLTAGAAYGLVHFFLIPPYGEFGIADVDDAISLAIFLLVAIAVSVTVEFAARSRAVSERSRVEAELLTRLANAPVRPSGLADVLEEVRATFGMTTVALLDGAGPIEHVRGLVGPPLQGAPVITVETGNGLRLIAEGTEVIAADRRLLGGLAAAAARAWEAQRLAEQAARARELAEIDRLRSALLAAVGHDLRTPLAGIKAAASSLRQRDVAWSEAERDEFLAAIEESADRLGDLVANLLAMSRLQAGVLSVDPRPVGLDELVARALLGSGLAEDLVEVDVPEDLPLVRTDVGLMERVIANLVLNACRFAPVGSAVLVRGRRTGAGEFTVAVIDAGPGVPSEEWEAMFAPFQRLDDRGGGVGLGLAIARGFVQAVGGTLTPSPTPGGGLTMTVTLPSAETRALVGR